MTCLKDVRATGAPTHLQLNIISTANLLCRVSTTRVMLRADGVDTRATIGVGRASTDGNDMSIDLTQPQRAEHWRQARALIEEYASSLQVDLSFQNLAHELQQLESEYAAPAGAFFLAEQDGAYVGCVGLRQFAADAGEIKRLYVKPSARGHGIARLLAQQIIATAKAIGYPRLLLDTLPSMQQAQSLYLSLGFKPTAAYRFNPVPGTAYLELQLR
jgi:putative acetyltransferase